jgi:H+/Cl- antiporter ClcA
MSQPESPAAAASTGPGKPSPEDIRPLEIDLSLIVAIGAGLFTLAFVVLLALRDRMNRDGHPHWLWIALAGAVFGLLGLVYIRRRDRAVAGSGTG